MLEKQLPYKYRAYEAIKKEILWGNYAMGDVLNERRLSETLGISRTPVREALQMLAQDGWIQLETYKGAVVREFDAEYLCNLACVRKALEVCAVEEAVSHVTQKDLNQLENLLAEQKKVMDAFDINAFMKSDRNFHSYIYDLSHNRELIHLLHNYSDLFRFLGTQAVLYRVQRRATTLSEHQAILDALRTGDRDKSSAAMKQHMIHTEENMRANLLHQSSQIKD